MNEETKDLGSELRRRIDAYLDAIDRVLSASGMNRSERRNITDDVETQIQEMLAARGEGAPTLADVEAVLAELDPPEAYTSVRAETSGPPRTTDVSSTALPLGPRRFSRTAIVGALGAPLLLICFFLIFLARQGRAPGPAWWQHLLMFTALPLGLAAPFGTTILGIISISQIRRSAGRLYGLGLALFDALLFPLLALDGLILKRWLAAFQDGAPAATEGVRSHGTAAPWFVTPFAISFWTILCCVIVDGIIIYWAWRAVTAPPGRCQPEAEATQAAIQTRAGLAKIAVCVCLGGLVPAGLVAGQARILSPDAAGIAYLLFVACQIAAFVLGVMSWKDSLGKAAGVVSAVLAVGSLFLIL
jgi:hypothetical protein